MSTRCLDQAFVGVNLDQCYWIQKSFVEEIIWVCFLIGILWGEIIEIICRILWAPKFLDVFR